MIPRIKINESNKVYKKQTLFPDFFESSSHEVTFSDHPKLPIVVPKPFAMKTFEGLNYYNPKIIHGLKHFNMHDPYHKPEDVEVKVAENKEAEIENKQIGIDKVVVKDQPNTLYYQNHLKGKDSSDILLSNLRKESKVPGESLLYNPPDIAKLSREQLTEEIKKIEDRKSRDEEEAFTKVLKSKINKTVELKKTKKLDPNLIEIKPVSKKRGIIESIIKDEVSPDEEEAAEILTTKLRKLNQDKQAKKAALKTVEKLKRTRVIETNRKQENMTENQIVKEKKERSERNKKNYRPIIYSEEELADRTEEKLQRNSRIQPIKKELAEEAILAKIDRDNRRKAKAASVIAKSLKQAVSSRKARESVAEEVEVAAANKREREKSFVASEVGRIDEKEEIRNLQKELKKLKNVDLRTTRNWSKERYLEEISREKQERGFEKSIGTRK